MTKARSRKKAKAETPAELPAPEPVALAEPLGQIMASREAKASVEPEAPQQRPEPGSHAAAVLASRPAFRPVPSGFKNVDSYPAAGLKVNRSLDKTVVAIQFAEDRLPERGEKDRMEMAGIKY